MAKTFYETILGAGFAGEYYDVAVGPALTDVLSTALSSGNGALGENAPLNLISTGALNADRELDITATEQDGRIFFLSVRNSDIATNTLTIVPSVRINDFGPTDSFIINEVSDWIFIHETGGVWRAYEQLTSASSSSGSPTYSLVFTVDGGVTSQGTRYLRTGEGVFCSSAGINIQPAKTLSRITVQVNAVDASRAYDVQVISNSSSASPTVLATLSLPTSSLEADSGALAVAVAASTELGVRLVRSSGSGASTFKQVNVLVVLT